MKQLILLLLLIGISMTAQTQDSQAFFVQLTEKYAEKDGFSASMLTKDMFDLYLKKKKLDENSEGANALKNLDKILVVSQSAYANSPMIVGKKFDQAEYDKQTEANKQERDAMYSEMQGHYKNGGFTLLKTEKRMGEDVKVYLKKSNEKVSSLALITNSSAATNLVELSGDIDLANVASLQAALNLRGLENLYKIDNKSPYQYIAADAAYFDENRMKEFEERARVLAERQAALSEDQIKRMQEVAEKQAQKQMAMADKYREFSEVYRRQPIFLNYPGDSTDYFLNGQKATIDEIKQLNNDEIKSIEVNKASKDGDRTVVKIKTK